MNYKKPFKLKDNFFLDVIWLYYTAVKLYISFKAFLKKKIGQKWVRKGIMIGLRMSWAPNNSLGQGSLPHAMLGQDGNMLLGLVRQNPLEALPTILSITLGSYRTQHHLEALAMPPPPPCLGFRVITPSASVPGHKQYNIAVFYVQGSYGKLQYNPITGTRGYRWSIYIYIVLFKSI